MLKTYSYAKLSASDIAGLCERNIDVSNKISSTVEDIINRVKDAGDQALADFSAQFDGVVPPRLVVEKEALGKLAAQVDEKARKALQVAYANIYKFHQTQLIREERIETSGGVHCWRESRAIQKVGLYIPGGTAVLPSTLLMLGIPAKIAGCRDIVVCCPPAKDGKLSPYIAYVAKILGIEKVYLAGGAQAIAAMALGTETIPRVSKIFGPGNQYVTRAKMLVHSRYGVAIDMPAGPSEVLVIADETCRPDFVASDLLAQAEHSADSQAVLVATSADIINKVNAALSDQLAELPRMEIAGQALSNSFAIETANLQEAVTFANHYASEHLIIASEEYESLIPQIRNAGSVFLGNFTPEAAGDYASGTNHTLPTSGFARAYSGVSVDAFIKKITFQHITEEGIANLAPIIETLAGIEGLEAHKRSSAIRRGV
ncbi:MAG: histidinol dehydrogenase [Solitalea sp.]